MKFFVLALFLSQSTAVHHEHQMHHRHQVHRRSQHQTLRSFDHKPNFDQFLALGTVEGSHHKMQVHHKSFAEEQGILEKVQQKFEKEEKEKEQIRIAKEAQEMQEKAFQEAALISQHKIKRNAAHQQEALAQASSLIDMIKKGNVSAEQLSQIMLGQVDLGQFVEDEQTLAPLVAPIAVPVISAPVEQPQQPAIVKQNVNKVPEAPKKVDVVQKVQPKAFEKPQQQQNNILPESLPQMSEPRADDLEDSISSIAQRVVEEKHEKEAKEGQRILKEYAGDNSDMVDQPKKMTMSERAENKFITNDPQASKEDNEDKALDNPISEYFSTMHPDVVKTAQERHYLTDQV